MFDKGLLELLNSNPNKGMSYIIDQFTPLVHSIVKNKLNRFCSNDDIKRITLLDNVIYEA